MPPEPEKQDLQCWAKELASLWSCDQWWLTLSYNLCKSHLTPRGHTGLTGCPQGCRADGEAQQPCPLWSASRLAFVKITHWVFVLILQTEETEEIHRQLQMVLTEISKLTNNHELKIANRLFGEKTYLFLQVSFTASTISGSHSHEWPMALLGLWVLEARCLCWLPGLAQITWGPPVCQTSRPFESSL